MTPIALIAEDEPLLAAEVREELARLWPALHIAAVVHDGHAALAAAELHRPNVRFLDVKMPGLDGLEVARLLGSTAHVVFITAFDRYAVQAFDEGAVDYLLKPIEPGRLARAVQRVKQRMGQAPADLAGLVERIRNQQAAASASHSATSSANAPTASTDEGPLRWITVQLGRELRLITVEDICYLRADNKYVCVVTADGEALISTPLKELMARLDPQIFWQVHRSTIVNVNAVRSVVRGVSGKLSVQLKQRSERLEVSASYAHRFKQL
jgi:DNA-binding LytR/AlgR family response regulator